MGNQNSAQRPPATSASSSASTSTPVSAPASEPPTRSHSRRDSKHPIPVHGHRIAAPPEPSLAQAQGSTTAPRVQPAQQQHRPSQSQSGLPQPQPPLTGQSPPPSLAQTPEPSSSRPQNPSQPAVGAAIQDEPTRPVAVPNSSQNHHHHHHRRPPPPHEPLEPTGASGIEDLANPDSASMMMSTSSIQDLSYLTRPPRLPLPIEEEIHTPGSPIISPDEVIVGSPVGNVEALDSDDTLNRKSSALSANTVNEEEAEEELRVDKTRPTVPFTLEWPGGGEKVYVTGTIFQWNRKHRLHPVEGKPGVFAATINILPGTHHVRFLVDGQMQTSPDLPTTVDFGNNLVNYIEVSATEPATGVLSAQSAEQKMSQQDLSASRGGSRIDEKTIRYKEVDPVESFEYDIPKYLMDFDQPEDSRLYHRSVGAIEKLPTPPSLPGFLGKPILNAAVLIKDDNSVLNMPNHTVLNHLATSSIKNNVLAVSATTRYKSKYVTTIIYKPTSMDG